MKKVTVLFRDTIIMTCGNLIIRSASVALNAYLTAKAGSQGMGLFQLVMTVYSLAVTFSCAGTRLASMRMAVDISVSKIYDEHRSLNRFLCYSMACGGVFAIILYGFSDIIAVKQLSSITAASTLRILSFTLPFVAMSSVLGGFFTAKGMVIPLSCIQLIEQGIKAGATVLLIRSRTCFDKIGDAVAVSIVISETASFILLFMLKSVSEKAKTDKKPVRLASFLRIALPDAAGSSIRSLLLTVEHTLIPKGFERSGENSAAALSAYGNIHGMAMPLLLYPSAILSSFSSLLIPELAKKTDKSEIKRCVQRNLKRTFLYSAAWSIIFALAAPLFSKAVYHSDEAVLYIRILAPLVPIMYTDMVTDGMLKGLDQQVYSMNYNIIDSALCVILVMLLLPVYSVKGYIFILYISEILNFYLSISRLNKVCEIKARRVFRSGNATFFPLKKYSAFPRENESLSYRDRLKHSQVR